MSDNIYRIIEVAGSSPDGIDAAIGNAVSRAGETVELLRWFEVTDIRGHIENGRVAHFQVTAKIGFTLKD
jgi:hypothetical protein